MSVDYVSDWRTRLRSRMYEQFKGLSKITAWIDAIAVQAQALEDASQAVLTIIDIDASVGAQLDNLGRLIGQPRGGVNDVTYRLYLRARLAARRSKGTSEDLYTVFRALFGDLGYVIRNGGNKSFALSVLTVLSATQLTVALTFLKLAKEAGARAVLEWPPVGDDPVTPTNNILRWDVEGHGFDVSVWGAANQV